MSKNEICLFLAAALSTIAPVTFLAQEPPNSNTREATQLDQQVDKFCSAGEYSKAIPIAQKVLELRQKSVATDPVPVARSIVRLGMLYTLTGDYAEAEPLLSRGLASLEKTVGPEESDTGGALYALAVLYQLMGDYAKAEPLYQRTIKIYEKVLGVNHPTTAMALNSLAILYQLMGDYAKAELLYQRTIKIYEKVLGPNHPTTAMGLNALAMLYQLMGNYDQALPLYQRAVKIYDETLGPEHPNTARGLTGLGYLYYVKGDYGKAEPLYQRALNINEKVLGPDHPETANSLTALALLYDNLGDYDRAEPLYQRALKIREKVLGPEHPLTAMSLENLAFFKISPRKQTTEALGLAKEAHQARETHLSNMLSFTSEQERLAFQKTNHPYDLAGTLGDANELAEIVVRQKGVVLDSLLEDRLVAEASKDPRQQQALTDLRGAKQRLMQLLLEPPKDVSEAGVKQRESEKQDLSQCVEQLEAGLARQVAGLGRARRALSVGVPQVQRALGKDETLIELLRYHHYLGKNKLEPRYGAVVIAASGEPQWVPLGSATEIEKDIAIYQKAARGKTDETTLNSVLHTLHAQVWAAIEKALPSGTKTIIVSPDAELSFVSFATLLMPDDKFLAEKYSIRYVASGRDLLRQSKPPTSPMTLVYANPDFRAKAIDPNSAQAAGATMAMRSVEMRDLQGIQLRPLLGTVAEAEALEKRGGKGVKVFLGPNATEAELRKVNSPRVLHLATHGFFLPELELGKQNNPQLQPIELGKENNPLQQTGEIPKTRLVNPMHRSGIALCGAQRTLEAWSRGEVPPTENDGIVTAEEIGGLKLDGTSLVVLSACDTGLGEARAGEGVMGLRRGFIQAGAQNLLMTLWPINDQLTVKIMLDFYEAVDKSHNAPQALAEVQRDWLVELRSEHGREYPLLDAVKLAGPFIMSSQGKP